jgi:gamma-glutamyltranspeptidase/glutathione hydrolase
MTVVDSEGNACSFINSLFGPFGTGIVGGSTGIPLQNRGNGFTLEEGHFNEYAPGVRPFHTIIPGMVTKDGDLYMSYGLMGGSMQPQGHVQFLLSHIDHGFTIQEAAEIPRFRHTGGLTVRLESGTPESVFKGLAKMGHDTKPGSYVQMGGAQAIMVHPESGVLLGASDPRKDGVALGY